MKLSTLDLIYLSFIPFNINHDFYEYELLFLLHLLQWINLIGFFKTFQINEQISVIIRKVFQG